MVRIRRSTDQLNSLPSRQPRYGRATTAGPLRRTCRRRRRGAVVAAGEFTHPRVPLDDDERALITRLRSLLL
jgi:hypothetical protein